MADWLHNNQTEDFKGLVSEVKLIPKKIITEVYTLTPAVIKSDRYWRSIMSVDEYLDRLKVNLIKKYNAFNNTKINEDFEFINYIEFHNKVPVAVKLKDIKLLGDEYNLHVANNETAQELWYMAIGVGICEVNSRGFGFINYKWI